MKLNYRKILYSCFFLGFITFKGFQGYKERNDWKATLVKDGETFVFTSNEANKFTENYINLLRKQKEINPKSIALDVINKIEILIVDDKISVEGLFQELQNFDQVIDNPFFSNEDREHLYELRGAIVETLREYGKQNTAFLEAFEKAEAAMEDYRNLRFDSDIIKLQQIILEEGIENALRYAKKLSETDAGKRKLQKLFGDTTMDGKTVLEMVYQNNIST